MISPTQLRITYDRRQDLLAEAARAHLIAAATRTAPTATPRGVGRLSASLRQAGASLVALIPFGRAPA